MIETALPTRQILWNVENPLNSWMMYGLLAICMGIAAIGVFRRVELWGKGKPDPDREGRYLTRLVDLFSFGLLQKKVARHRSGGIFHTLIYLGFMVLLFTTTMVFIDHDLGIRIYQGDFYLAVTVLSDVFGLGVLFGCMLAMYKRYSKKEDRLHNRLADSLALFVICLLIVQGFLLEGLRIHATNDPWARYSPVGLMVANFFWPLSEYSTRSIHFAIWWFHTISVFAVFALLPYTKFFHIIASAANLFFLASRRPKGAMRFPGDLGAMLEKGEEFSIGRADLRDYTWKEMLDLDACTSCGRCQEVCPAYISGKPLSPKWLILDTRNHALLLQSQNKLGDSFFPKKAVDLDNRLVQSVFLRSSGLSPASDGGFEYSDNGEFRADNKLVQGSAITLGKAPDQRIMGEVMDAGVFWSCTTCMACVQACPVGINHVDQILENRRNSVLMQGEIPSEAQGTLRALENRANPFGAPEERVKWSDGLSVKILKPGDSVDYLYWVGCVSAFDARKQKIARALVRIMQKADLSFGILGSAEGCSGDPARRLGEENLFQTLAKNNIELLRSVKFKTLVANCPHCFNTMKNEYPQLGNLGEGRSPEIIHHSVLLKRLLAENKITLRESDEEFTFHDPCYLGRYNDEYDAPRSVLAARSKLPIVEMEKSREKGMCCGAGGGHFWMDLKVGERVNTIRIEQVAETGSKNVATACPFCMQMLEDGVKLTNREGKISVKDIAEVVAERLEDNHSDPHGSSHAADSKH